jgi:tetraprenyl-beta-curcumene synthase
MSNAMPLGRSQCLALLRAVLYELRWGLAAVSRELRRWRGRAMSIPDAGLRADALHALECKRGHTDGAALFWTLPGRPGLQLLRLLVTYEVIYDYLDNVSERAAAAGHRGEQLFLALGDALDPDRPLADYYRSCPFGEDGGYLRALVQDCRALSRLLPSFDVVRPYIARETARAAVLAINHDPVPARRDDSLRAWVATELSDAGDLHWYELAAAASQSVVTFALLALAAEPDATRADAQQTYQAYFPWFAYAVTMLDSYVDQAEDLASGAHSYIAHYPSHGLAVLRLCESAKQSARRLLALRHGERHAVLLGCMIAMYLSKDSARADEARASTRRVGRAGGRLTAILLPVLRIWRISTSQTSAT